MKHLVHPISLHLQQQNNGKEKKNSGKRTQHAQLARNIITSVMKLRQGNVFTPVCHSVHRGVCLADPPDRYYSRQYT